MIEIQDPPPATRASTWVHRQIPRQQHACPHPLHDAEDLPLIQGGRVSESSTMVTQRGTPPSFSWPTQLPPRREGPDGSDGVGLWRWAWCEWAAVAQRGKVKQFFTAKWCLDVGCEQESYAATRQRNFSESKSNDDTVGSSVPSGSPCSARRTSCCEGQLPWNAAAASWYSSFSPSTCRALA